MLDKLFNEQMERGSVEKKELGDEEVRVLSRFRRHANPEKDPETGLSFDALNEAGIEQAEVIGCNSKQEGRAEKIKKSFNSPNHRTWETVRYMLDGAGKEEVKSYEKEELDTLPWLDEDKKRLLKKEDGSNRSLPELVNAILYDKKIDDVKNTVAERMAWRVKVATNMPKYLEKGDDVEVESVTHGPNQEILLSKILKVKNESGNGQIGFDNTDVIGGMFQPGEGFEVENYIDSKGEENKKIVIYRMEDDGTTIKEKKEYEADWDKVDELAESYRSKKVAEIKENK
ncbi:hypothetical protein K8R62_01680 [bacterium]|nr:hypothetical protein [bacterium]